MMRFLALSAVAMLTTLLAGCPSHAVHEPATTGSAVPASGNSDANGGSATAPLAGDAAATTGPTEGLLGRKVIYFDFDRSEIRSEFAGVIAAHARYLGAHATAKVRLEGNSDERGTREYNIGLGERRAQAVRRALMLQGVNDSQLSTVSYGEERPAVEGEDEAAWSQNRRVEIVYTP
jgi:peptidoglycan-associated lipoprotein